MQTLFKKADMSGLKTIIVIVFVLCIAWYFTYTALQNTKDDRDSDTRSVLSEESGITYTDLDGQEITLDSFTGKVRIVNSWASWSPFSKNELKDLEQLAAEYKDSGVVVIGINRMEDKERAKRFLSHIGSFENIHFILDPEDAFYSTVGGFSVPETVFYDANGHTVFHMRGEMTLDEMRKYTDEAIEASK